MRCIAICYGGAVEERFVTGIRGNLIYLSSSEEYSKPCAGVGFPAWSVFEYDCDLARALKAAIANGDSHTAKHLREKLKPLDARSVRKEHASRG